eukprot:CAMPEP_0206445876 /NCGR_PEP_ID=MMETSP0324_2-20121206/15789_1 /ASSEMBLY_ACC=CAM_ASM_000836 /TAXON_ID=2866 /ORGANISM="Crypthecodinium cohnii, Strain Seligo" /LENGTH=40 /DNA_ID= /DNA_START= /DNA_END= /DNA_ORIENTATION=
MTNWSSNCPDEERIQTDGVHDRVTASRGSAQKAKRLSPPV